MVVAKRAAKVAKSVEQLNVQKGEIKMANNEFLSVEVNEQGVIHAENGKLIVGDLDVIALALAAWGGSRQRGRVVVQIFLQNQSVTNTSSDFSGKFMEASEPA